MRDKTIQNSNNIYIQTKWNYGAYHLFDREQSVYVEHVAPPIVWAILVIQRGRFKNGMMMKVFHNNFDETQYKHIWCGQTNKAITNQTKEMESACCDFAHAL